MNGLDIGGWVQIGPLSGLLAEVKCDYGYDSKIVTLTLICSARDAAMASDLAQVKPVKATPIQQQAIIEQVRQFDFSA